MAYLAENKKERQKVFIVWVLSPSVRYLVRDTAIPLEEKITTKSTLVSIQAKVGDPKQFLHNAPYLKSPYQLQLEYIKMLRKGMKIRVVDDYFTRAQYLAIGDSSGIFPGEQYIIKEVMGTLLQIEGVTFIWGYQWFEVPSEIKR